MTADQDREIPPFSGELGATEALKHEQYMAFRLWMNETQGGSRPCPAGSFPNNFYFWLKGGRW